MAQRVTLREISTKKASFDRLLQWFTHVVLRFISYLTSHTGSSAQAYIWRDRIQKKLALNFTELCTKEFIRLIQEFPESTACLQDLKIALQISQVNDKFVQQVNL